MKEQQETQRQEQQSVNHNQEQQMNQQQIKRQPNKTGIPDRLKAVIEHFSGLSLNEVRVHYNSEKPALMNAHAYAEGLNIYIAPGQEKHLAHEIWHVVQQMKGNLSTTTTFEGGKKGNDNKGLEQEADQMGNKMEQAPITENTAPLLQKDPIPVPQRMVISMDEEDAVIQGAASNIALNKEDSTSNDIDQMGDSALADLQETETLYIVAHGYHSLTDPSTPQQPNLIPMLKGGIKPEDLYQILVSKGWPETHRGKIDVRACMTGAESMLPNFAELLGVELAKNGRANKVVGYKHLSATNGNGDEVATKSTVSKMAQLALQADVTDVDFAKKVTDLFQSMNDQLLTKRQELNVFVDGPLALLTTNPPQDIQINKNEWLIYSLYHSIQTENEALRTVITQAIRDDDYNRNRTVGGTHETEVTPDQGLVPQSYLQVVASFEEQVEIQDHFVEQVDEDQDQGGVQEQDDSLEALLARLRALGET